MFFFSLVICFKYNYFLVLAVSDAADGEEVDFCTCAHFFEDA